MRYDFIFTSYLRGLIQVLTGGFEHDNWIFIFFLNLIES